MHDQEAYVPTHTPLPGDLGHGPIVRHGRNPLSISLLGVLVLSGVRGLLDPEKASPALYRVLGEGAVVWNVCLLIGCATALAAVLILKPLTDVLVERIGAIWLASLFLVYAVVIGLTTEAATSAAISFGLGLAFALRAWQITKDLHRLRRILQALPARGEPTT